MPESETEKHGISLGSHFSDKARHVPIKKRRLILRSPSPPPSETSPCAVETADQKKSQDASNKFVPLQSSSSNMNLSQTVDTNNSIGAKKTDKSNKRSCDDDDFSGISILAAAACSSSLGKDCGYAEDGSGVEDSSALERAREVSTNTETHLSCKALSKDDIFDSSEMSSGGATSSCISVEPVGEHASLFTIGSQQGESVGKGLKDASLGEDCLTFSDETVRNQRPSSRANRLHWDLNVVMDDWEQPFDDPCAQNDFARNVSQDVWKLNHNGNDTETEGHNLIDDTENVRAAQCCLLPGELRASVNRSTSEINDKADMDVGFNLKQSLCLGEKSFSSKANFNLDVMNCLIEDTKCGRQGESSNPTDDLIIASQWTQSPTLTLNETEDASVMSLDDNCIGYQPTMEGLKSNVDVSSYQSQNCVTFDSVAADTHIASCVSSNSDTLSEVKQNVAVPEFLESSKNFNCEGNSLDDVDLKTLDPQGHPEIGIPDDNSLPGTDAANSISKRFSVDVADADADGELLEDYDSQYEDGELRESSGCAWEEYDATDREGGVADYVSNNKETHISNPIDYHVSVSRQVDNRKNGRVIVSPAASSVDSIVDNQAYRKVHEAAGTKMGHTKSNQIKTSYVVEKTEPNQLNEQLESHKCFSEMAISEESGINSKMSTFSDGLLDSRSTETTTEPKAFRRGLQSQIEAPLVRDEEHKKIDNRFEAGPTRSFDRMQYSFHNQSRGRQRVNWDDSLSSRRVIRRHYSPISHGRSKLDKYAVVDKNDHRFVGTQDDASYSHPFPKTRAGDEEAPCAGFYSQYKLDRKFSSDRGVCFGQRTRGTFRHAFGGGRGGRGRFNGPSDDEAFHSSLKYGRLMSRRERSISPFGAKGQANLHHPHRNSPSRSRSRSPVEWISPMRRVGAGNGGDTFHGQRSRSPTFRSERRMHRLRSPHRQPGFGVGHAGGFRSVSRNHGSPSHYRWNSARNDDPGQFRELGYKQRTSFHDRSPGKIQFRDDRSCAIGSPRNPRPDGFYRISERVPDDDDIDRYGEKFDEKRNQFQFFRPARCNYDNGMVGSLRQDNNDGFTVENSFQDRDASSFRDSRGPRGIDSRIGDAPRRFRRENHSIIRERDGKFNHDSKQFGVGEINFTHNLKSEEQ